MHAELTLTGELVNLREFADSDIDDVAALIGDDRVTTWLSFDSRSRPEAVAMLTGVEQRRKIDPRTEYYLAITAKNCNQCIGFVRLGLDGVKAAKLGYATTFDQWGKGYASEAARLIINFGFRSLGLHRISAAIGPDNAASIRLAENLKMTFEGRIRDHVFTNGKWRDSLLYSVLSDEWFSYRVAA